MDRFLTEKARHRRWWELPVAGLSILMGIIAVQVCVEDTLAGPENIAADLLASAMLLAMTFGPLFMVALRWARRWMTGHLAKRLAQQTTDALPLDGLDGALGIKNAAARIRFLTAKGYLRRVELDDTARCLRLEQGAQAPSEREEAPRTEDDDTILKIRRLNDEIDDEAVSVRIDRLERVTASIFRAIEERPERADEARRFMNYYLPTTLRLLESYRLMEEQSYQGENIQSARRQIEEVLEKLVHAAEQQQDKLFRSEALDVDAEISVLETMMAADGFGEQGRTAP